MKSNPIPRTAVRPRAKADSAEGQLQPQAATVLRRFRLVFSAVKAHFRRVEKVTGIGGAQLWALSLVESQPGVGVNDLARAMDIHQTTASNLVKSLVKIELIETKRGASDRRTVQLYTLAKARKLLKRAPGPYAGVLPQALAELDQKTLARLDKDLTALIARLGVDATGSGVPLGQ